MHAWLVRKNLCLLWPLAFAAVLVCLCLCMSQPGCLLVDLQRTGKGGPDMELAFVSLGRSQGAASLGAQRPPAPACAALLRLNGLFAGCLGR
jgi:hypothetical protein